MELMAVFNRIKYKRSYIGFIKNRGNNMEHIRYINGEQRELTPDECTKLIEKFVTNLGYRNLTSDEQKEYERICSQAQDKKIKNMQIIA